MLCKVINNNSISTRPLLIIEHIWFRKSKNSLFYVFALFFGNVYTFTVRDLVSIC